MSIMDTFFTTIENLEPRLYDKLNGDKAVAEIAKLRRDNAALLEALEKMRTKFRFVLNYPMGSDEWKVLEVADAAIAAAKGAK